MSRENHWVMSVGFRHVLEDCLAILEGRDLERTRREYVLSDLAELLGEAQRGADLVQRDAFFVNSNDRTASESYSLFDRYLSPKYQDRWKDVVGAAGAAITGLRNNARNVSEGDKVAAKNVLAEVLSNLRREPHPGIPLQPEELRLRG